MHFGKLSGPLLLLLLVLEFPRSGTQNDGVVDIGSHRNSYTFHTSAKYPCEQSQGKVANEYFLLFLLLFNFKHHVSPVL